jgi:hypothetical protein
MAPLPRSAPLYPPPHPDPMAVLRLQRVYSVGSVGNGGGPTGGAGRAAGSSSGATGVVPATALVDALLQAVMEQAPEVLTLNEDGAWVVDLPDEGQGSGTVSLTIPGCITNAGANAGANDAANAGATAGANAGANDAANDAANAAANSAANAAANAAAKDGANDGAKDGANDAANDAANDGEARTATFRVRAVKRHANGHDVVALQVELSSPACTAPQLLRFLDVLHERHLQRRHGDLATAQTVFEQRGGGGDDDPLAALSASRGYTRSGYTRSGDAAAAAHVTFVRNAFHSTKRFANLCGPEVRLVERRMQFFMNNRAWYDAKGVPYRIGMLLSGETGSGKSSTIQALANLTRRHIVNVNLARIATGAQLRRLFQSDDLDVHDTLDADGSTVSTRVRVPLHQRLYVIEEIDTVGDVVVDRRITSRAGGRAGLHDDDALDAGDDLPPPPRSGGNSSLTLGDILQVLDGSVEAPGRVLVITSNFPERLDSALVRPGRIDLHVNFRLASRATIVELYEKLHDTPFPPDLVAALPDDAVSLAEATEAMFRAFGDPAAVVDGLAAVSVSKAAHAARIDAFADAAVVKVQAQAEKARAQRARRETTLAAGYRPFAA